MQHKQALPGGQDDYHDSKGHLTRTLACKNLHTPRLESQWGNHLLFYLELWYRLCYNWFPNKALSSSNEWAAAQLYQWDYCSLQLHSTPVSTSSLGIIRAVLPAVPQAAVIPTGSVFFPAGYLTLPANDWKFSIWCSKGRWNNPLSLAREYTAYQCGFKWYTKTRHHSQRREQFTPFTPHGDSPATRDPVIRNQSAYFNDAEPLHTGANVVLCWCLMIQVTCKHRGLKCQQCKTLWQRHSPSEADSANASQPLCLRLP